MNINNGLEDKKRKQLVYLTEGILTGKMDIDLARAAMVGLLREVNTRILVNVPYRELDNMAEQFHDFLGLTPNMKEDILKINRFLKEGDYKTIIKCSAGPLYEKNENVSGLMHIIEEAPTHIPSSQKLEELKTGLEIGLFCLS